MLLANGWHNGQRFNVTFTKGALVYEKHPAGKRKVAGTIDRPILDTNTAKLSKVCGFSTGDRLPVTVTPDRVTVGEAVSVDKVAETVAKVADPLPLGAPDPLPHGGTEALILAGLRACGE